MDRLDGLYLLGRVELTTARRVRAREGHLIAYRDFHLRAPRYGFFGIGRDLSARVTFDDAVEAANAWIATRQIRVITVESVWREGGHGAYRAPRAFRVWYDGAGASLFKVPGPPEL